MSAELPSAPVSSSAVVIAVDGPVAAGKGTLARRLATLYGYAYLDSGALYRAVGAKVLREGGDPGNPVRSEEHTSELQSLMRISYAVFCLIQKKIGIQTHKHHMYDIDET